MKHGSNIKKYWEFDTEEDHYKFLIGSDYGTNPIDQKKELSLTNLLLRNISSMISN